MAAHGAQPPPPSNLTFEVNQPLGAAHAHVVISGSTAGRADVAAAFGQRPSAPPLRCSLEAYRAGAAALQRAPLPGVHPSFIPDFVIQGFSSVPSTPAVAALDLPPSLAATMYRFQTEGVRLCAQRRRALLADEMGLGKTIQAIAFATHFHRLWPLLIIAPSSLRANWRTELATHVPWLAGAGGKLIHIVESGTSKLPVPPEGFQPRAPDSLPPWVPPAAPSSTPPVPAAVPAGAESVSSSSSAVAASSSSGHASVPPAPVATPAAPPSPLLPRPSAASAASEEAAETAAAAAPPPGVAVASTLVIDEDAMDAIEARGGRRSSARVYKNAKSRGSASAASAAAEAEVVIDTDDEDIAAAFEVLNEDGDSAEEEDCSTKSRKRKGMAKSSVKEAGRKAPPPVPPALLTRPSPWAAAAGGGASSFATPVTAGPEHGVVIVSFDMLKGLLASGKMKAGQFKVVVVDESHSMKETTAQRTIAASPIIKAAEAALLLSGTPALNRPKELYSQLHALRSDLFRDFWAFAVRYCDARQRPWGVDVDGSSHLEELRVLLNRTVMLRRLKADVESSLPPKIRRMYRVGHTTRGAAALAAIAKATEELKAAARRFPSGSAAAEALFLQVQAKQAQEYHWAGVAKLPGVIAHVLNLVRPLRKPARDTPPGLTEAALEGILSDAMAEVGNEGKDGSSNNSAGGASGEGATGAAGAAEGEEGESGPPAKRRRVEGPSGTSAAVATSSAAAASSSSNDDEELDGFEALLAGMDSDEEGSSGSGGGSGGGGFLVDTSPKVSVRQDAAAAVLGPSSGANSARSGPGGVPWQGLEAHHPEASAWRGVAAGLVETRPAAVAGGGGAGRSNSNSAAAAVSSASASSSSGAAASASSTPAKVVVFGHHQTVLSALCKALDAHNPPIEHIRIDGSVSVAKRDTLLRRFQTDPSVQVAVVGLKAAGVGLTFTAASIAVFAELDWVPGALQQAEARIHRLGQRAPSVEAHYLVGPDATCLDMRMWESVAKKLDVLESTLGAGAAVEAAAGAAAAQQRHVGAAAAVASARAPAAAAPVPAPAVPVPPPSDLILDDEEAEALLAAMQD